MTQASALKSHKIVQDCKVFFFCSSHYEPLSICIAEGLKELGIPIYADKNHWQFDVEGQEYLFTHHPEVKHSDCSIVVVHKNWLDEYKKFPENLLIANRPYLVVYLDEMDGPLPSLPEETACLFDYGFRTHCHKRAHYPKQYSAWAFGLSNRILQQTCDLPSWEDRKFAILANFRNDQEQILIANWTHQIDQGRLQIAQGTLKADYPLRPLCRDRILPQLQRVLPVDDTTDQFDEPPTDFYHALQWQQTGQRHYPQYYQRLRETAACAAFAGWLVPKPSRGEPYVEWWDTWRFWESLAAGCVTFHVDFDKYGVDLPIMPENWRHYIGIDFDNIEATVERIASDPGILERISQAGRKWSIEHYSPVPTALRFLRAIGVKGIDEFLPFDLRESNLIVFPDWTQPEEVVFGELVAMIQAILNHPEYFNFCLLLDISGIDAESADMMLSSVAMEAMMSVDLEIDSLPAIELVGSLRITQWEVLSSKLRGRVILPHENQEAIASLPLDTLPSFPVDYLESL